MSKKRKPRPQPADYPSTAPYYVALLRWLQKRYPDITDSVARAREWRRIEKEDAMPVKKKAKSTGEKWQDRAIREAFDEMLERAGRSPAQLAAKAARLTELETLKRPLTDAESAELVTLSTDQRDRERRRRKTERAIEKRQAAHPGESHVDSLLAISAARLAKREAREDAKDARRAAAAQAALESPPPAQAVAEPVTEPVEEDVESDFTAPVRAGSKPAPIYDPEDAAFARAMARQTSRNRKTRSKEN